MTSQEKIQLSKDVFAHYEATYPVIKHYYGILSMLGALKTAEVTGDTAYIEKIVGMLKKFPEGIEHPRYNFPSYLIGGNARAYALFKGYMTDDRTKALVREYAEEFMTAPRDRDGVLKSPFVNPRELIWIDVATAVTPYLLYAGLALNEPAWIDEAIFQTLKMYDIFLDPANGLLHQTKGEIAQGVITEDHWGRGNGWGYFPLAELVQYLPQDHPEYLRVCDYFGRHSFALLKYQTRRGLWCQEITDLNSYEEASGTGLILYGYGVGLRMKMLNLGFKEPFEEGIEGMCRWFITEDKCIKNVCPGCRTPGRDRLKGTLRAYTQHMPVTDDQHGFGPIQLALAEAALHE